MKPTLATISAVARTDKDLANRLFRVRSARSTRYAARATVSQQKRRRAARQSNPNGF